MSNTSAPDTSSIKYKGTPDYATRLVDASGALAYDKASPKTPIGADADLMNPDMYAAIMNAYHVISISGGNYPITDNQKDNRQGIADAARRATAIDLINNPVGARIYAPSDFLLCARYGLPINRMITLRRFSTPIGDNITDILTGGANPDKPGRGTYEPDIGRLVTYMDQNTNKLSDILSMTWGLNWKELTAGIEKLSGNSEPGNGGWAKGWMGSLNKWLDSGSSNEVVQGEQRLNYDPTADANKTHGPVDSIAQTYIRDVGLKHDWQVDIVFDYELRSFNGLNQKAMFLDALANVLAVTMNNGRFWGGARIWTGSRPSALARKLSMMNPRNAEEFLANAKIGVTNFMQQFNPKKGGKEAAVAVLKQIVANGMNLALGKFLDMVGRPAIYQMNSLLRNEPVGEWHLTIGNPLNPIVSVGNLILDNTKIEFGDQLGYDDFPTSFKVTCTLKGGMPRDRAGIEAMFNNGYGRLYWPASSIVRRTHKADQSGTETGAGKDINGTGAKSASTFGDDAILKAAEGYSEFQRADAGTDELGFSIKQESIVAQPPVQPTQNSENSQKPESAITDSSSENNTFSQMNNIGGSQISDPITSGAYIDPVSMAGNVNFERIA